MKNNIKRFCIRGLCWAWGGPFIMAIVWFCLFKAGQISSIPVGEAVFGIISTTVMAFIAAGVSIVYDIEKLPKGFAALIQFAVLYIDYLGIYLLNGWIPIDKIWIFSVIFAVGFIVIWLSIYIPIKIKVAKLNKMIEK